MRRYIAAIALVAIVLALAISAHADTHFPGELVVPFTLSGAIQSPYLAPFAISDFLPYGADYSHAYTFYIKSGAWQSDWLGIGNMGLIDLGNGYGRDQVAGTVSNSIAMGDSVAEMTGNKIARLQQGMDTRLNHTGYNNGQYSQWIAAGRPTDNRVIVCPVIHQVDPLNGSHVPTVVGFVGFYVDDYSFGTTKYITGVFTDLPAGAVPEPSALLALSSLALGALALRRRRV